MAEETKTKDAVVWTNLSLIDWGSKYLSDKGFDDPRLNVELLLCNVLHCERIDLYLKFDNILKASELSRFKELLNRRTKHEPIQYIIGETEFFGLKIVVDRQVFIPRPETEVLVEQILSWSKKESHNVKRILDIGTGSGNIAISLAKKLEDIHIDSIDISPDALEVAFANIWNHHLEKKISLICANILDLKNNLTNSSYDVIVSNPPYISKEEFQTLQPEIRNYEPVIACTDRDDGLTFYRVIAGRGKKLLRKDGVIFVEVAYNQSTKVTEILEDNNYRGIELYKDYNGIDRVVKGHI